MHKSSLTLLTKDSLILTANKRLAKFLMTKYDQMQISLHKQTWETPQILLFDTWIQHFWETLQRQDFTFNKIVLNPSQEHYLWKTIIQTWQEKNDHNYELLNINQTAITAQQTWHLIYQYKIPLSSLASTAMMDSQFFFTWAQNFQNMCEENHWISRSELCQKITEIISKRQNSLDKQIAPSSFYNIQLAGFIELPPDKQNFIKNIDNISYEYKTLDSQKTTPTRCGMLNSETEIYTMARWAKQLLEDKPNISVGCVVPNLSEQRNDIERIFREVFSNSYEPPPYNISLGKKLSEQPAIKLAFKLLHFILNQEIITENLSIILCSPYLLDTQNFLNQRSILDAYLRKMGKTHWTLRALIQEMERSKNTEDKLLHYLKIYLEQPLNKEIQLPAKWAEEFQTILQNFGWLSTTQTQIAHHFLKLLDSFSQLNLFHQKITATNAISQLQIMSTQQEFIIQSDTEYEAPIQILGILESIGLNFDHLWVMGMDHKSWPTSPKPNIFLPIFLQKKYSLPHSDNNRELNYCKNIIQNLIENNQNIIFSYAKNDQEKELSPSPLIKKFKKINIENIKLSPFKKIEKILFENKTILEKISDNNGPELKQEKISGGTSILKDQAACPFKAFAIYRLKAKPLENPKIGLDAKDRGLILHHSLELLFKKISSSTILHELNPENLEKLIENIIEKTLQKIAFKISYQILQIEKKRILKLIKRWIALEKKREPFEVIEIETKYQIKIGKLNLNVRIDRLDKIKNHHVLIDYKTGFPKIRNWFGDRLDEPQLPLYASLKKIDAIAFAQVNNQKVIYHCVSSVENLLPQTILIEKKSGISWNEQRQLWQNNLKKLADEFSEGYAKVNPKDPSKTCRYCHLKSLCRIDEHDL